MTNVETMKTSDFLRRRKLRIQQVREQSNEIAKRIRQRAGKVKLRQVEELEATKKKEYFKQQEQLVKHLELLYSKGIKNVGSSHRNAAELISKDDSIKKVDLSQKRAKAAATQLQKQKQAKLDEQNKLLDRKLQAREAANQISREKSSAVASKLRITTQEPGSDNIEPQDKVENLEDKKDKLSEESEPVLIDMSVQCNPDEMDQEIPALPLQNIDQEPTKDMHSARSKKPDLFALSDEMPSSLCGGLARIQNENIPVKPSLTIVSEYLQNRCLRLREPDKVEATKQSDELQTIKQTILRNRVSRTEVKKDSVQSAKSSKESANKISSISLYDHATKQVKAVPFEDNLVIPEHHTEEDAYTQALKEGSEIDADDDDHQKKLREMRSKIAMTKQNVEKEYKDTMAFLNSLPKGQKNVMKSPYEVERREQIRKKKMQDEFRAIERECKKHKSPSEPIQRRPKSRSPSRNELQDNFKSKDFEYSWMPVPESDGKLTVHTIPDTVQQKKSGNTVKFSKVDSYHEYRSRHKHTPPTKDYEEITENTDYSSLSSESSVENIKIEIKDKKGNRKKLSNTAKRAIYKILKDNSEENEENKGNYDLVNEMIKCLNENKKHKLGAHDERKKNGAGSGDKACLEKLDEGVYETATEQGDHISSMFFSDQERDGCKIDETKDDVKQTCRCKAKQSDDHKKRKGTNIASNSGDNVPLSPTRSPKSCLRRECGCSEAATAVPCPKNTTPPKQPSVATSTTSFKTNKPNDALPNGGFIKLIDEGGNEAGKFYIGATGFLRDDAYEVLIQLRKNKDSKPEDTAAHKNIENSSVVKGDQNLYLIHDKIEVAAGESQELLVPVNTPDTESSKITTPTNLIEKEDKAIEVGNKMNFVSVSNQTVTGGSDTELVEKKSKMISAATQTTLNGSLRPSLNLMSSSTSTAYMSPPEMILPTYLRRDLSVSYDETCDQCSNIEEDEVNTEDYKEFLLCKSHRHARNMSQVNKKFLDRITREQRKLSTPPNTVRSCSSRHGHATHKRREGKCPSGSHIYKNVQTAASPLIEKIIVKSKNSQSNILPNKSKRNNSNLNPVLKDYVNKLLSLNKEGLKAIEVINQDCSSISTPGSSIINDPRNLKENVAVEPKISLEQIKEVLTQHIVEDFEKYQKTKTLKKHTTETTTENESYVKPRVIKRKSHKVRTHVPNKTSYLHEVQKSSLTSSTSSLKENYFENEVATKVKNRSKSSPTPRTLYVEMKHKYKNDNSKETNGDKTDNVQHKHAPNNKNSIVTSTTTTHENTPTDNDNNSQQTRDQNTRSQKNQKVITIDDTGVLCQTEKKIKSMLKTSKLTGQHTNKLTSLDKILEDDTQKLRAPITIHNQEKEEKKRVIGDEKMFQSVTANKIQNMEKIAELTEQSTNRLTNLAKRLEEVRKNKSSVYSPISSSESTSDSDNKSDKELSKFTQDMHEDKSTETIEPQDPVKKVSEDMKSTSQSDDISNFIPLLSGISKKPDQFVDKTTHEDKLTVIDISNKPRGRPPPALSRVHLKDEQGLIIPHELSTVLEVDSPISLTIKNVSTTDLNIKTNDVDVSVNQGNNAPNLRQRISPKLSEISLESKGSVHKIQMPLDIKQFNEIMLKPFITIKEYAKQCNINSIVDEDSNIEELQKDDKKDNDRSSSPSNGSLPDVISELLKRNLISEPFKFESVSNVNTSSFSSESTLSLLALNTRKDIKKPHVQFPDKENVADSSDSLSLSSNPDLERAFKKLGMGWASSTLRKTKERLALSSSTNTSSSSLSQFRLKSFKDLPSLNADSVSALEDISKIPLQTKNIIDDSKDVEQQTSLPNSMTVKEFLKNELAKKITFTNKSTRNDSEEFVSMYDTKIPEQIKLSLPDDTVDSPNGNNNRARTSTPVQLYKSLACRSSSSSNNSNGLFSNADELSSVKGTSNSFRNSTSDKDDLTIPNCSLKVKKGLSDRTSSKSE